MRKKIKNEVKIRRKLQKIIADLNQIFTAKEIERIFKIPQWKIYRIKRFRKIKLPSQKTIEKIEKFHKKLLTKKRNEEFQYHYRVFKRRILPDIYFLPDQINRLVEKYGLEKTAKKLKISKSKLLRWKKGEITSKGIKRIPISLREKIFELYKEVTKKLVGIFLLGYEFTSRRKRRRGVEYLFITYLKYFYGSEDEFIFYLTSKYGYGVVLFDYLIAEQKKFDFKKAKKFIKNLKLVSEPFKSSSIKNLISFVEDNFKGKERKELLKEIEKYE